MILSVSLADIIRNINIWNTQDKIGLQYEAATLAAAVWSVDNCLITARVIDPATTEIQPVCFRLQRPTTQVVNACEQLDKYFRLVNWGESPEPLQPLLTELFEHSNNFPGEIEKDLPNREQWLTANRQRHIAESTARTHLAQITLRSAGYKTTPVDPESFVGAIAMQEWVDVCHQVERYNEQVRRRATLINMTARQAANNFFATITTATYDAPPQQQVPGELSSAIRGKPGRPRYAENTWAYEQVNVYGRKPDEVYQEWLERVDPVRLQMLEDPRDSFKKAIKVKPPKK
jgi:hypothetical protein